MHPVATPVVQRAAASCAAGAAVATAVGADIAVGGHPLHTLTLGLVGLVVAALRLRLSGRQGGLFAAVTAVFLAQPVLHLTMKLLPDDADRIPPAVGGAVHAVTEASVTTVHVLLAAIIVLTVACAEQLLLTVAMIGPLCRWLHRLRAVSAGPTPPDPAAPPPVPAARRWGHVAHHPRRGPPVAPRPAVS